MSYADSYQGLAKKVRHPDSEPLLKILSRTMTPEEAAFILEMPAEKEILSDKFKIDVKDVEKKIDNFMKRGLVVPSRKGVRFPNNLTFVHEAMLSSAPELIPEGLPDLWKELYECFWRDEIGDAFEGVDVPALRVLPVQKSVPEGVSLLPWEDIKAIVQFAKKRAVRNCACRVMVRDCGSSTYNCMQFNKRADYAISRGSGSELSAEDMLEGCLTAEDEGLVPMVGNIGLMDRMDYICYCCSCCCTGLDPLRRKGKISKGYAKSRFSAEVNLEKCNGCRVCVKQCRFDAIEMRDMPGKKNPVALIDSEKCYGCGVCVIKCKPGAVTLSESRPPEHIPSVNAALIP